VKATILKSYFSPGFKSLTTKFVAIGAIGAGAEDALADGDGDGDGDGEA
jgi:hypothetical protein